MERLGRKSILWGPAVPKPLITGLNALTGFGVLLLLWYILSHTITPRVPDPLRTLEVFWELLINPFYDNGPNDKGIGLQLWFSLQRVFLGFAVGALIAVPVGIVVGSSEALRSVLNPVIQVLRPVSPLAWFPVGLAAFQASEPAAVFVIAITSLWPTLINTALGVGSIPQDYRNVARVFAFTPWTYLTRVVLPHSLPYVFTGFRLGMGIAWMVIVAAEMLAGGTGVGFFVWDSYNSGQLEYVMAGILFIGFVGWGLDALLGGLVRRFSHG
ncbi:nitrate ABC transporter permease [Thermus tengchongensis]|uniref:Nitrate ABC transporter, permease protein n=1 Tax=Thermus tengchongensis TaxID=1214928 RepID=A0ABY2K3S6_9DEIN|nr:nitrate ABC transporter permease [Thermus tengchongensis]TFU14728.1 nitrate ABC transporter, permease protein [Thermus tengchongensis]